MASFSWKYERSVPLQAAPLTALERVRDAFLQQDFQLVSESATGFEASGPGMSSTGQDPLRGVSKVRVDIASQRLALTAELGALRRMQYLIFVLPCFLLVIVCFVFLAWVPHGSLFVKNSMPSLFLSLLMFGLVAGLWLHGKTTRALDRLVDRAAQ